MKTPVRQMRIEFKIFLDGESEPELSGYHKVPWPVDETLDDVATRIVREACHKSRKIGSQASYA